MERAQLVRSQAQELSALPVQHEPESGRELPRRSRLVAHLAILSYLCSLAEAVAVRAHYTHARALEDTRTHACACSCAVTAMNDKT